MTDRKYRLDEFNRRNVLKTLGIGTLSLSGLSAGIGEVEAAYGADTISKSEFCSEQMGPNVAEILPDGTGAYVTTSILGDGLQLYWVEGATTESSIPDEVYQFTNADYGVHNLSFDGGYLKCSMDGGTYRIATGIKPAAQDGVTTQATAQSDFEKIDSSPLPVDYKGNGVACGMGWCVRIDADDYGSLACNNYAVPAMNHGHFAVYPSGDYRTGVNFWVGHNGNCIWAGEEHKTQWCTKVCGPEGGVPAFGDLVNIFKDAINRAADAAGVAVPAFAVIALAYYLAGSTLAPPTGVPLV